MCTISRKQVLLRAIKKIIWPRNLCANMWKLNWQQWSMFVVQTRSGWLIFWWHFAHGNVTFWRWGKHLCCGTPPPTWISGRKFHVSLLLQKQNKTLCHNKFVKLLRCHKTLYFIFPVALGILEKLSWLRDKSLLSPFFLFFLYFGGKVLAHCVWPSKAASSSQRKVCVWCCRDVQVLANGISS